MIKHLVAKSGHLEPIYEQDGIRSIDCTRLELDSEIMRLDKPFYIQYKSHLVEHNLSKILDRCEANVRESYLDNVLSDLVCEFLVSNVVFTDSRTDGMWLFDNGIWEYHDSGSYLWLFLSDKLPKC
ncbi:hypothetical protein K7432_018576, partial [Basidiobolus ranarum]